MAGLARLYSTSSRHCHRVIGSSGVKSWKVREMELYACRLNKHLTLISIKQTTWLEFDNLVVIHLHFYLIYHSVSL